MHRAASSALASSWREVIRLTHLAKSTSEVARMSESNANSEWDQDGLGKGREGRGGAMIVRSLIRLSSRPETGAIDAPIPFLSDKGSHQSAPTPWSLTRDLPSSPPPLHALCASHSARLCCPTLGVASTTLRRPPHALNLPPCRRSTHITASRTAHPRGDANHRSRSLQ